MAGPYQDDEFELSRLLNDDDDEPSRAQVVDEAHEDPEPAPKDVRRSTEFLDGLRGLAAVWVFVQHFMPGFTGGAHELGFGQEGTYLFVSLPLVRLFFGNGGNSAVVIFFVLSGYVLSVGPLQKLKQGRAKECRKGLLGALIRRPFRLYIPPFTISFIHALLLHVPGPLFLPLPWLHPDENTIIEEIQWWWEKSSKYFSIFSETGSNLFAYPYNVAVWTLPIELKGSILVYTILLILTLGLNGADHRTPLMVAIMMFSSSAIMLQRFWKWSMACFMFGMTLALLDTWPIGAQIREALAPPGWVQDKIPAWAKTTPDWVLELQERWESIKNVKLTPNWLRSRLPKRAQSKRKEPGESTIFAHVCFFVGVYLLSEPSHGGVKDFSRNTPGWKWLTEMIPQEYGEDRYYRYWEAWGAFLAIYGVLRINWLQRFFTTRVLKFFGFVSFMLYLVHLPFFRIFPDRFNNLIGMNGDPTSEGTFWDKSWPVPEWGPVGMNLRFLVSMAVCFPTTLFVAWIATLTIDQPSVKFGKLITRVIGLDKPKKPSAQEVTTSSVLFPSKEDAPEEFDEASTVLFTDGEHRPRRSGDIV